MQALSKTLIKSVKTEKLILEERDAARPKLLLWFGSRLNSHRNARPEKVHGRSGNVLILDTNTSEAF